MAGKWLYAPIVILEGRQGRAALARSKVLVDRLGGGLGKIFPLFVLVAVSVSVLTITLSWSLIKQFELGMSWLESVIVITTATSSILLCILLGVLFSPLMAIGISLFYLKARQAGSETLLELFQMSTEQAPLHSNR